MKKLIALILAAALLLLSLTGCDGIYKDIWQGPDDIPTNDPEKPDNPSTGEKSVFTVKIIFDDELFTETAGIEAQWQSATSVHRAAFDPADNIAKIEGLDGDYSVTLVGLPDGYMYDTNVYKATNNNRNIEIEIFEHVTTRGEGSGPYNCIGINRLGAYTAEVDSARDTVFYQFSPTRAGTYVIDTICDVMANEVNPAIDVYVGTFANKYYSHTVDSGASEAEYTRNAHYVIDVDAMNIGADYTFAIKATHKESIYPVQVSFVIKYASNYVNEDYYSTRKVIIPDQNALYARGKITQPKGKLVYPEVKISNGVYIFDNTLYGLNKDTGCYHLYNEASGKYDGPMLYAKITKRHRFFALQDGADINFANVESISGTAVLAVEDGTEWYKLFIEGGSGLGDVVGLESYTHYSGLANFIDNKDGVYPVTEEVKIFLQKFAISQRYFNDGMGWAETTAEDELGYRIYASEESQWLFACCYYLP